MWGEVCLNNKENRLNKQQYREVPLNYRNLPQQGLTLNVLRVNRRNFHSLARSFGPSSETFPPRGFKVWRKHQTSSPCQAHCDSNSPLFRNKGGSAAFTDGEVLRRFATQLSSVLGSSQSSFPFPLFPLGTFCLFTENSSLCPQKLPPPRSALTQLTLLTSGSFHAMYPLSPDPNPRTKESLEKLSCRGPLWNQGFTSCRCLQNKCARSQRWEEETKLQLAL